MKIDRLLGILTYLLEKDSVTAPELAERFEVSRRTVRRDIEALGMAGFPIVTRQGAGGGISLMEGFRLERKALKKEDLADILVGLKGLKSVSSDGRIDRLLARLSPEIENFVSVDLSSFYGSSLSPKIALLKEAAEKGFCVRFQYFSPGSEEIRLVEPLKIHYRWSDWYLFGYCRNRDDFRMFKLNRLWDLELTEQEVRDRIVPSERERPGRHLTDENELEVIFDRTVKHLLVESYGPRSFTEMEDGRLLFRTGFTNRDFILRWLLRFGGRAEITKPRDLALELKKTAREILEKYENI